MIFHLNFIVQTSSPAGAKRRPVGWCYIFTFCFTRHFRPERSDGRKGGVIGGLESYSASRRFQSQILNQNTKTNLHLYITQKKVFQIFKQNFFSYVYFYVYLHAWFITFINLCIISILRSEARNDIQTIKIYSEYQKNSQNFIITSQSNVI